MTCLYVDKGNTAIKWRIVSPLNGIREGRDFDVSMSSLMRAVAEEAGMIDQAVVSSVATPESNLELKRVLAEGLQDRSDIHFAKVQTGVLGLDLAYEDLSSLGVDRWLMMLAVVNKFELPAIVVSAGTALTVDKINENRVHLGGLIAPGWSVLSGSLNRSTAKLKHNITLLDFDRCKLGVTTEECLNAGASLMFLAYLTSIDRQFANDCRSKILCGGDASDISAAVELGYVCKGSLVLDGLEILGAELNS